MLLTFSLFPTDLVFPCERTYQKAKLLQLTQNCHQKRNLFWLILVLFKIEIQESFCYLYILIFEKLVHFRLMLYFYIPPENDRKPSFDVFKECRDKGIGLKWVNPLPWHIHDFFGWCSSIFIFNCRMFIQNLKSLPVSSSSESYIELKIKLKFYSHRGWIKNHSFFIHPLWMMANLLFILTFLCVGSKGFMKAFKAFKKPFEEPQRSVKIKI